MSTGVAASATIVIPPLFSADETKPEMTLKSVAIIDMFLLFINGFFGYWVSLDRDQFESRTSLSWSAFCAWTVVFYMVVQAMSFVGFVAILFRWSKILNVLATLCFALFCFGLTNVGLRANGFCFALLFFGWILLLFIAFHYTSLVQCSLQSHPANCRGECFRQETVQWLNERIFFGRLELVVGTFTNLCNCNGNANGPTTDTHVRFNNEVDQQASQPQSPTLSIPTTSVFPTPNNNNKAQDQKSSIGNNHEPTETTSNNSTSDNSNNQFVNHTFSDNLLNDGEGKSP